MTIKVIIYEFHFHIEYFILFFPYVPFWGLQDHCNLYVKKIGLIQAQDKTLIIIPSLSMGKMGKT